VYIESVVSCLVQLWTAFMLSSDSGETRYTYSSLSKTGSTTTPDFFAGRRRVPDGAIGVASTIFSDSGLRSRVARSGWCLLSVELLKELAMI
jgi:hypothetical protein